MFNSSSLYTEFGVEPPFQDSTLFDLEFDGSEVEHDENEPETDNEQDENYDPELEEENNQPQNVQQTVQVKKRRTRQYVATLTEIQNCVQWMFEEFEKNGRHRLMAKTVERFPQTFNTNMKADLQRASRYWNMREKILTTNDTPKAITRVQHGLQKRANVKANVGRGRKRSDWTIWLEHELTMEFERLLNIGVEFSSSIVMLLAKNILERPESLYKSDDVPPDASNKTISQRITHRWVQTWRERNDVILRTPCGKAAISTVKQEYTDQCVAYHLGQLRQQFLSGDLDESCVHNLDETHLILDQTMSRIYGFKARNVKLTDVVSGTEALTLVLRVSGGPSAKLHCPFIIFANRASSYPIRRLPDLIEGMVGRIKIPDRRISLFGCLGVTYRTSPKGWMTKNVFFQYMTDDRAMEAHSDGKAIHLYVDNCTGHTETAELGEVLQKKKIKLRFLPKNSTDVAQPLDNFLIKTVKEVWTQKWQQEKSKLLQAGEFSNTPRGGDFAFSGKLKNPGKLFFLTLAAAVIKEVNEKHDKNGISHARKCMIRTGLSLDVNGIWHVGQLSPELQAIIHKYPDFFQGREPELPS